MAGVWHSKSPFLSFFFLGWPGLAYVADVADGKFLVCLPAANSCQREGPGFRGSGIENLEDEVGF